jgi:hypothetical protein
VLANGLFSPWYHLWWIYLALAIGHGRTYRMAMILGVTGPLSYLVWVGLRRLDAPHVWCQMALGIVIPAVLALRHRAFHDRASGDRASGDAPPAAAPATRVRS